VIGFVAGAPGRQLPFLGAATPELLKILGIRPAAWRRPVPEGR
jgi:hypothetical protein